MLKSWLGNSRIRLGLLIGVVFGVLNLLFSWLFPLEDDNAGALLRFYGPMFFLWALASFRAARRDGRFLSGVTTGLVVAFATFCVYDVFILIRVNLFLGELTGRSDWQSLMARFKASGSSDLRAFVMVEYLKQAPLKIGAASLIGAFMGAISGLLGRLGAWRAAATA